MLVEHRLLESDRPVSHRQLEWTMYESKRVAKTRSWAGFLVHTRSNTKN